MLEKPATLRTLARSLGLSRATISSALRGTGRVSPDTQRRVREAARQAGYRHNPLAATLMSELRRSTASTFRGVIATIDLVESTRPGGHGPFHRELVRGAQKRATELGFKIEQFTVDALNLTMSRLDTILLSRGIDGLLLLPSWNAPDFSALSWNRYAGVYTDYNLMQPSLNSVCSDHYRSMLLTLERLRDKGYRRPGLFIEHGRNERLHRRHVAAFRAFHESDREETTVPPLITPQHSRPEFEAWFQRFRPEVVLCHHPDVLDWMIAGGACVPATHGFVCLNSLNCTQPCAALDLQPREIGARGLELIVAQLHRNDRGIPDSPTCTIIPSRWVDGPTVRN